MGVGSDGVAASVDRAVIIHPDDYSGPGRADQHRQQAAVERLGIKFRVELDHGADEDGIRTGAKPGWWLEPGDERFATTFIGRLDAPAVGDLLRQAAIALAKPGGLRVFHRRIHCEGATIKSVDGQIERPKRAAIIAANRLLSGALGASAIERGNRRLPRAAYPGQKRAIFLR